MIELTEYEKNNLIQLMDIVEEKGYVVSCHYDNLIVFVIEEYTAFFMYKPKEEYCWYINDNKNKKTLKGNKDFWSFHNLVMDLLTPNKNQIKLMFEGW